MPTTHAVPASHACPRSAWLMYSNSLLQCMQVDVCSIEEVDEIARLPNSVPASAGTQINMDGLLEDMWDKMALVRVYTKRVGA